MSKFRYRQIERCYEKQKNPDILATYEDEKGLKVMICIPSDELQEYKEQLGWRLNIWDWAMPKRRKPN